MLTAIFLTTIQIGALAVPIVLLYLAWRFLRAYERRNHGDASLAQRVARLERLVAELGGEPTTP